LGALGHPVRLALLRGVLTGRQSTCELAALDGHGTTGQLYHHLHQLQGARWLRTSGRGRYEVPAAQVISLLVIIAFLATSGAAWGVISAIALGGGAARAVFRCQPHP
ncbi:MAG: helix-turn-helix domain-containing protein, partial [Antricoccus sp.]